MYRGGSPRYAWASGPPRECLLISPLILLDHGGVALNDALIAIIAVFFAILVIELLDQALDSKPY